MRIVPLITILFCQFLKVKCTSYVLGCAEDAEIIFLLNLSSFFLFLCYGSNDMIEAGTEWLLSKG